MVGPIHPGASVLYPLLGFKHDAFPAGLGWHDRVSQGVPRLALWAIARALGAPVSEFADLVDVPKRLLVWRDRRQLLSPETSVVLYRYALAMHRLLAVLPSREIAANWLKVPRKELDGSVPVRLLLTQPGADAVFAAIARIVVTPTVARNAEPAEAEESAADESVED